MSQITKQQALNKWDRLPMILREAVFSERNADILWGVCESQHLAEDKISAIAALSGKVIMGFLHSEDLVKEIKKATGIHQEIADLIVKEIDRKIFSPIRSEIDKAYALPIESEAPEEEIETQAPKIEEYIVTDIRKGDIKITRYDKSIAETTFGAQAIQVGEIEPMKIVSSDGEEKIILSGAELSESVALETEKNEKKLAESTAPIMPKEPIVIHKEKEIETAISEKFGKPKPIGDLFGFLNDKKEAPKKETTAEMKFNQQSASFSSEQTINDLQPATDIAFLGIGDQQPTTEKERLVHYDIGLTTPLNVNADKINVNQQENQQEPILSPEIKKEESKPKLFFKNIIQTFKPTVKVVDFVEQPQTDVQPQIDDKKLTDADMLNPMIETEAPKIIMEEVKEEKEGKEGKEEKEGKEGKEGFFKKLFKFKKEKPQETIKEKELQTEIKQEEIMQDKIEQSETEFKEIKQEEIKSTGIALEEIKSVEIAPEEIKIEEIKIEEKPAEISSGEPQEKKQGFFGKIFGKSKKSYVNSKIAIKEKEKEIQEIKEELKIEQPQIDVQPQIDDKKLNDADMLTPMIETEAPKILTEEKPVKNKTKFFLRLFKKEKSK